MAYTKKHFLYSSFFIISMAFSSVAAADKAEYQFGVSFMSFNYAEYTGNNIFLDGETGLIPGVVLKRRQNHKDIYTEFVGKFSASTVKYDGQTQAGIPATTNSGAIIFDTHFKVGMNFTIERDYGPYMGLGYRYWFRNILPGQDITGNPVAGLLEEYYWLYGLLGYEANINLDENINVGFDIRFSQMFNAKMDIDFLGYSNLDNTRVNLGNESGLRLAVPVKVKTNRNVFIVAPYYEIIDIGKSNTVPITVGGATTGFGLYEPRSETRNVGIDITWIW